MAGWPTTYGSWGAPEGPSAEDELVVAGLRRAGFVLAGRTNTPEFGPITVAENSRYGATRNPWDLSRSPGGSSGGAAAAVAAGMFPLAHANDGGGSIRIPASCCGLVGLKPSRGRIPSTVTAWEGAAVEGAVTRTVADAAALLDAVAGRTRCPGTTRPRRRGPTLQEVGVDPGRLRVGVVEVPPLGMPLDPQCLQAVRDTATRLADLGHAVEVVPLDVPDAMLAGVPRDGRLRPRRLPGRRLVAHRAAHAGQPREGTGGRQPHLRRRRARPAAPQPDVGRPVGHASST